eukprot:117537-Alexandrium_andersonii.AAC.1
MPLLPRLRLFALSLSPMPGTASSRIELSVGQEPMRVMSELSGARTQQRESARCLRAARTRA